MSDMNESNNSIWIGGLFIRIGVLFFLICAIGIGWCLNFFFDDIYLDIQIGENNRFLWLPPLLNVISYFFTTIIIFILFKTILNYFLKIKNIHGDNIEKWKEKIFLTKTIDRIIKAYSPEDAETVLDEFNMAYNNNNSFLLTKIMVKLSKKEDDNIPIIKFFKFFKVKQKPLKKDN